MGCTIYENTCYNVPVNPRDIKKYFSYEIRESRNFLLASSLNNGRHHRAIAVIRDSEGGGGEGIAASLEQKNRLRAAFIRVPTF